MEPSPEITLRNHHASDLRKTIELGSGRGLEKLPPLAELGFGKHYCSKMAVSVFENGRWGPTEITELKNFSMHPGAKVLHYAQEIFEGMKVYRSSNSKLSLFRPEKNIKRMIRSAEIMAMPPFPEKEFLSAILNLSAQLKDFVPVEPGALYLRPTMIATNTALGVAPSSEYIFYVLASPVGGYFGDLAPGEPASIKVLITEDHVRAVRGGLGAAKTGANYAASLRAVSEAKKKGFDNVLFLDALERQNLEELSGMNIFVRHQNKLITPELGDTILDGVTRRSIIELARTQNLTEVIERKLPINELVEGIQNKSINEVFACGTGASVTAISSLGWRGQNLSVGEGRPGELTRKLYRALLDIQYERAEPPSEDWRVRV